VARWKKRKVPDGVLPGAAEGLAFIGILGVGERGINANGTAGSF